MYVILVYDMDTRRVGKMLKLCRRYLNWIQNSVFEGEISPGVLARLIREAEALLEDQDSLIYFQSRDRRWLEKHELGVPKSRTDTSL